MLSNAKNWEAQTITTEAEQMAELMAKKEEAEHKAKEEAEPSKGGSRAPSKAKEEAKVGAGELRCHL